MYFVEPVCLELPDIKCRRVAGIFSYRKQRLCYNKECSPGLGDQMFHFVSPCRILIHTCHPRDKITNICIDFWFHGEQCGTNVSTVKHMKNSSVFFQG